MTTLLAIEFSSLVGNFELIVDPLHSIDLLGDGRDLSLFLSVLHRAAQRNRAILRDDLHVLRRCGQLVVVHDGLANLLRDVPIGFASTLIPRRLRRWAAIPLVLSGVVSALVAVSAGGAGGRTIPACRGGYG